MNKTKIDWADYTINPVKGLCPVGCSYCYARRMYKRFHWNPEIRYDDWVWQTGSPMPAGSRIFVGSTMELFHEKTIQYLPTILEYVECLKSRTFIFLTKCPQNLPKQFPDNCWVGVSATNAEMCYDAMDALYHIKATVKFVSFEPLLERANGGECDDTYRLDGMQEAGISWVILGQCTPVSVKTRPRSEWIQEILDAADKAAIPVFVKDNILNDKELHWLKGNWNRREFPEFKRVKSE